MQAQIHYQGQTFTADLRHPIDISVPLDPDQNSVRAFGAPPLTITPVRSEDFIGLVKEGGAVNFQNICLNPHGNGTHTECVGHITQERFTINQCLTQFCWPAQLISTSPRQMPSGDQQIQRSQLREQLRPSWTQAVIIRTYPNPKEKAFHNYSGTSPPYLTPDATAFLRDNNIKHLLIDLPSVDKEDDEGRLRAHKAFWNYPKSTRKHCTITELIHVPNRIEDGFYLLNLQVVSLEMDASPSKPVLYPVT